METVSREALCELGASELSTRLAARTVSSTQIVAAHLDAIARRNPALNCYTHVDASAAREAAAASDQRRARARALGPLDGIPVAVKDNIAVRAFPHTAGVEHR